MFVVDYRSDRLILRSQHRLPQLALAGVALILFLGALFTNLDDTAGRLGMAATGFGFLAVTWLFFPNQTIVFDRAAGTVVNERRRIGRVDRQSIPLGGVQRVMVEKSNVDDAITKRLALVTETARIPLETAFGSSPRDDLAKRINEWLEL